jgi:hypothetical protein
VTPKLPLFVAQGHNGRLTDWVKEKGRQDDDGNVCKQSFFVINELKTFIIFLKRITYVFILLYLYIQFQDENHRNEIAVKKQNF